MLLTKNIDVKICSKNIKHFQSLGYKVNVKDIQEELKTTVFAEFFSSVVAEKPVLPSGFSEVNITETFWESKED